NHRMRSELRGVPESTLVALRHYELFLEEVQCLVAGDFNNWYSHPSGSFKRTVGFLSDHGFTSCYHTVHSLEFGQDEEPTHYYQKKKPFHIDYCFTPKGLRACRCTLGERDEWLPYSDHVPLVVDLPI
ncbi:MAG: hypothetical protein ACRES4_00240, partial [Nevskiales bacterium]